ncbi:MAG: elongation factor G [Chloroflexota bacterium]|nr:MAG: elongation factor G [SAR202 cluster bacterium]MAR85726.1 elongation factor G [Chloroflexota bacterium]MEC7733664.1 elongation factor G [Chloroflexota bacterium]MEC8987315.1 elongation factor G [Chloroflexota bacterium]MED5409533.1 elongation factor G [Chloroflexota bacterium]
MAQNSLKQTRNIGFIAHIDAGKTTVSERVLYFSGRIHKLGTVDDGNTATDWMDQERERGITIVSAATATQWKDWDLNIIDTPGHVDFTAEVERSLRVLDGGIVVFDSVAGVQPQSETVWRQADKYQVPRICFINKMDKVGGDYYHAIETIVQRLKANPVPIQIPMGSEDQFYGVIDLVEGKSFTFDNEGNMTEGGVPDEFAEEFETRRSEMVEKIAEQDDVLLEKFLLEEDISFEDLKTAIRTATISNKIVPVLCGTALKNKCVQPLLDAIGEYLPSPLDVPPVEGVKPGTDDTISRGANNDEPFAALAFKTVTDPFIGRLVYFRVYSGSAKSGSSVLNTATGDRERLGRIVKMHADQREDVEQVYAGEIAAAIGLKDTTTGETISSIEDPILLEKIEFPDPVVSVSIEPKARADQDKLSDALVKLSDEDPTFTIIYDDETGQTVMSGMGELHLEILTDRMKREFKVEANVGKPRVAFRETIRKTTTAEGKFVRQSGGHGQYGHVIIEMEPLDRGEGVQFENKIRGGSIPTEFISSVEDGIRGALKNGPKSGFPVIDLLVRLIDGTYHDVDSSKVSFEIAGSMATRTAVDRCSPVVLEPVMKLEVVTPEDYLGEVIGDLGRRRAGVESIDAQGDTQIVKASLPLAESFGYANDLRSITQGRAGYSMEFEKYLEAPESVVESQAT